MNFVITTPARRQNRRRACGAETSTSSDLSRSWPLTPGKYNGARGEGDETRRQMSGVIRNCAFRLWRRAYRMPEFVLRKYSTP